MILTVLIHPDRLGKGPFLWVPIPPQANPLEGLDLEYWALTGYIPGYSAGPAGFNRKVLQDLCQQADFVLRVVPTKRKNLAAALNEKLGSGYVQQTEGLSIQAICEHFYVRAGIGHERFDPSKHLNANGNLGLLPIRPERGIALLSDWRNDLLEAVPWS